MLFRSRARVLGLAGVCLAGVLLSGAARQDPPGPAAFADRILAADGDDARRRLIEATPGAATAEAYDALVARARAVYGPPGDGS